MEKVFTVRKTKDKESFFVQMTLRNLFGIVATVGNNFNLDDMLKDDNYVVRIGQNGLIELGYPSDPWRIK